MEPLQTRGRSWCRSPERRNHHTIMSCIIYAPAPSDVCMGKVWNHRAKDGAAGDHPRRRALMALT